MHTIDLSLIKILWFLISSADFKPTFKRLFHSLTHHYHDFKPQSYLWVPPSDTIQTYINFHIWALSEALLKLRENLFL